MGDGSMRILSFFASALVALSLLAVDVTAKSDEHKPAFNAEWPKGRATGFPLPRFASLRSAKANMRVGPSTDYPTKWVYSARRLPLEITEEYGNWRRVRDQDGASGWMLAPLLSSRRTAVVGPWLDKPVPLTTDPQKKAKVAAMLSPKVRLDLLECDSRWCRVSLRDKRLSGFVEQGLLWGVYPGETVD
jgi:SH3-like domain-containing protein